MARDNSPKIRQRAQLERKKTQRASYDRILIVSEGRKRLKLIQTQLALAANADVFVKDKDYPSYF